MPGPGESETKIFHRKDVTKLTSRAFCPFSERTYVHFAVENFSVHDFRCYVVLLEQWRKKGLENVSGLSFANAQVAWQR